MAELSNVLPTIRGQHERDLQPCIGFLHNKVEIYEVKSNRITGIILKLLPLIVRIVHIRKERSSDDERTADKTQKRCGL